MDDDEIARLPYRPCVGVMLLNRDGTVWIGRRLGMQEAWQMPQGGIDQGESPADAAIRELAEEVGTAHARIVAESRDWLTYDLPGELVPKTWGGRFRGQRQKWFAMEFLGDDTEFAPERVAHPEFDAWQWIDARELPTVAVGFKQNIYQSLVEEFAALIERLKSDSAARDGAN
jgi:putative (di)nucleoside polyphosphate hydrolase